MVSFFSSCVPKQQEVPKVMNSNEQAPQSLRAANISSLNSALSLPPKVTIQFMTQWETVNKSHTNGNQRNWKYCKSRKKHEINPATAFWSCATCLFNWAVLSARQNFRSVWQLFQKEETGSWKWTSLSSQSDPQHQRKSRWSLSLALMGPKNWRSRHSKFSTEWSWMNCQEPHRRTLELEMINMFSSVFHLMATK